MKQLSFFYNMQIRKSDTFVASFPRSGTTMTQQLVWLIGNDLDYDTASSKHLCERYISLRSYVDNALVKATKIEEYQERQCKHIGRLQRMTWPTENLTDIDTSASRFIMSHIPFSMLPPDTLDTAKVVYVARNPLDVAVSMYHFYRSLKMYEFDLPAAIRRISTFLNKSYSDEQIKGLCEHMKFENFQKNEAVNLDFLKEFDVFVPFEQSFIRKGKTGGWRDYFDEAMTKEAFSWIEDNLRDTDLRFPELLM
ncbi:Sulfotransferase, partial [Operophtera brumata]